MHGSERPNGGMGWVGLGGGTLNFKISGMSCRPNKYFIFFAFLFCTLSVKKTLKQRNDYTWSSLVVTPTNINKHLLTPPPPAKEKNNLFLRPPAPTKSKYQNVKIWNPKNGPSLRLYKTQYQSTIPHRHAHHLGLSPLHNSTPWNRQHMYKLDSKLEIYTRKVNV